MIPQRPLFSMMSGARALPPQVHIMSLYADGDGVAILRLVNIFEASQHRALLRCSVLPDPHTSSTQQHAIMHLRDEG